MVSNCENPGGMGEGRHEGHPGNWEPDNHAQCQVKIRNILGQTKSNPCSHQLVEADLSKDLDSIQGFCR